MRNGTALRPWRTRRRERARSSRSAGKVRGTCSHSCGRERSKEEPSRRDRRGRHRLGGWRSPEVKKRSRANGRSRARSPAPADDTESRIGSLRKASRRRRSRLTRRRRSCKSAPRLSARWPRRGKRTPSPLSGSSYRTAGSGSVPTVRRLRRSTSPLSTIPSSYARGDSSEKRSTTFSAGARHVVPPCPVRRTERPGARPRVRARDLLPSDLRPPDRTLETRQGRRRREGPARDRRRLGRGRACVVVSPACHRRHAVRAESRRRSPDPRCTHRAERCPTVSSSGSPASSPHRGDSLDELATKSEPSDADPDLQKLADSCRSEAANCHLRIRQSPLADASVLFKLGDVLRARGDEEASLEAYAAAEKIDKEDGDEFFSASMYRKAMAVPLWQLGRYREALDEFEQIDELAQIDEAEAGLIDEADPNEPWRDKLVSDLVDCGSVETSQAYRLLKDWLGRRTDRSPRRRARAARCRRCAAPSRAAAVSPAGAANARARGGCKAPRTR